MFFELLQRRFWCPLAHGGDVKLLGVRLHVANGVASRIGTKSGQGARTLIAVAAGSTLGVGIAANTVLVKMSVLGVAVITVLRFRICIC